MKKVVLLLVAVFSAFVFVANSQVSLYSFSQTSGTYTAITGGTLVRSGTSTMDSYASSALTIPSFTFNGVEYTTAYMTSNGILNLGGTAAPSTTSYTAISTTTGSGISICPMNADLNKATTTASSEMRWQSVGDEVVFQWQQMCRYGYTESFDFQVRLNTVTGVVSFIYKLNSGPATGTSYQPQVGIRTSATDYNIRSVGTGTEDWATSIAGTANTNTCRFTAASPAKGFTSGLTYTFTPPICSGTPTPGNTVASTTSVCYGVNTTNLSLQNLTSGTGVTYQWQSSPDNSGWSNVATGGTSSTYSPFVTTPTYYRCAVTCSGSTAYSNSQLISVSSAPSLPWSENFDGMSSIGANIAPGCWTLQNVSTSYQWTSSNASSNTYNDPQSSPNYMTINYGGGLSYMWTPMFSLTGGTSYRFRFYYVGDGYAGWTGNLYTNTTQSSTGATLATNFLTSTTTTSKTTYTQVTYTFTPSSSGNYSFGIGVSSTSAPYSTIGIDDVTLQLAPSCVDPTSVSVGSVTNNSASVSFSGSGSAFIVEYGATGFTPGTGASAGAGGTIVTGSSSPIALSGLSAATAYDVYVRQDCSGSGNGYSANSSKVSFTTLCDPVSLPWSENFDAMSSIGANIAPSCWALQNYSSSYQWTSSNASSNSYNDPQSSPNYMTINYGGGLSYMWTPMFSLTGGTSYRFRFYYVGDGYAGWTGNLYTNTTQSSTGATLATNFLTSTTTTSKTTYTQVTYTFTPSSSGNYSFGIGVSSSYAPYSTIGIDDVTLQLAPSCVDPTSVSVGSITSNSASVSFSGSGSAFIVEYGATGFTPGTGASAGAGGTIVTGSSSPIALSGLSAATAYDVYVRQDCSGSGNGYSANSSKVSFTTLCNSTSVPYTQDFESVTTPALPSCSAFENAGSGNNWTTSSPAAYGFTTKTLTYGYNSSNAANAWFYTQGLNLTGGVAYVISYKYGNNSSSFTEKLKVAYGTSATYSAMTSVLANHSSVTGGSASTNSVVFTPSISGTYYFGFNAYSASNQYNLYVDDISINVAPWTWTGTTSTDWAVASNWDLGSVPNSSTNSVVIPNVTNKPIISSGTYSIKDATIATSSSLAINGTLQVFGNITNNATVTGSGTLTLNGSTAQTVTNTSSTNSITVSTFTLNNNTGATLSGSGFVNVTGTVNVTAGILASAGRLTLKSTATTNARVGSVAAGAISGSVNVERYFPGKRAFRFLGHPFNSSIALGQLMATNGANTGIDVTGAGGSTNGFTTTGSNNPSAFNYTPASGNSATNPDPGWNAIGSASATNWASKQGLRVFVRGTKGEGLNGLAYTPSATTVTMSGTLNDGSSPVFSLSNGASSDYNLIANPLASTIDMQALTLGGDVAGSSFYVWDVSQGAAGAYVNEPFASAATYRYLPLGSAFFARSASGAGTITFPEAAKVSNTPAAILRGTSKYGNNSIQLVLNDNTGVKHDRVLFFFSKRAAEEKDNMDGEKMTNPGVNFYANSKDSKKLSIDVRPLIDNTIIPLTLNTPFDREFTITAEDFNVTDNKDLLLHDKKTDTYTKLSAGVSYSFTSTLSDATTYGNRFELITKVNPSLLVENILDIKLSPNPVKDVLTINYSTPNATLEATTIIKITNNVGQIIENLNLGASATGSQKINMSKYAKGVYTIELVVGKEKVVKQIVKQ